MSTVATGAQVGRGPAGSGGLRWRLARLEDENAALRDEQQRLEAERERLRGENERLWAERERLREVNSGAVARWRRCVGRPNARPPVLQERPHAQPQGCRPQAGRGLRHPRLAAPTRAGR
jgi:hypothetical protein